MGAEPLVSIITPSYQQGRFLRQNLESVAGQAYSRIEHIVHDGGSTDETLQVLKSASRSVRWVSEPDRGQTDALNRGLAEARGEIVGWVNSDDFLYPNAVTRAVNALQETEADAIYGRCSLVDEMGQIIGFYRTEPFRYEALVDRNIIAQPALFFRRSLFERFGPLDETLGLAMDYEYWLRSSRLAKFVYVPEVFAAYRIHPAAKTASQAWMHASEANRVRMRYGKGIIPPWKVRFAVARTYIGGLIKSSPTGLRLMQTVKWQRIRH